MGRQAPVALYVLALVAVVVSEDILFFRNRGWFWERTNCCLFDRLPGAVRCADCSRTPPAARRAAYREFLDQP